MRVLLTSFAALLTLAAFGPAVTGLALGEEPGKNAGTNGKPAAAVRAPAVPAPPAPAFAPQATPARPPAPAPAATPARPLAPAATLAPIPMPNQGPAGQVRDEVRHPVLIQAPGAGVNVVVPGNANVGAAVNQNGDQWRYRWHNGAWWYWTPENRWMYHNGDQWLNHEPAAVVVPDAGYSSQPVNGYYQPYTTGYGGYYGPAYQGGYYGRRGYYYGEPGVSIGLGFGPGIRIGW